VSVAVRVLMRTDKHVFNPDSSFLMSTEGLCWCKLLVNLALRLTGRTTFILE